MKIQRIWFCCCLIFCIFCLSILVDEQFVVTYLTDDNGDEQFQYLGCLHLESLQLNRTEIQLRELAEIFGRHLKQLPFRLDEEFRRTLVNRIRSHDLVIVLDSACVILKSQELVTFKARLSRAVLFAFKRDTFDFLKVKVSSKKYHYSKFDQLIVLNKGPPYSDCVANFSRFHCMQECFKRGFRLSEYFYFGNESGLIQLNQTKNETIRANERSCCEKCSKSTPCKLVYLSANEIHKKSESVKTFIAQPVISRFDFGVQLAGLVCSTIGVFFSRLLRIAIEFLNSKLRNRRKRRVLVYLRLCTLSVGLLCCAYLFVRQILAYNEKRMHPTRTETTRNLRPETMIHLVVCVPVRYILSKLDCCKRFQNVSMNMLELEQATDGALNETIDSIALNYLGKSVDIRLSELLAPKVMFASFSVNLLSRCFQLAIRSLEPRYQTLLSISKLEIKFKHKLFPLFLLVGDENLNSENFNQKSFLYSGKSTFLKRVERRSRFAGQCIDYEMVYSHLKCTNRMNCIERCVQRSFFDSHHNRVTNGTREFRPVIDRDQFSPTEWRSAYLDVNHIAGEEMIARKKMCMKQIRDEQPCVDAAFEESVRIDELDAKTRTIELYYEEVLGVEEMPSGYKLALDLLNIQSIFFGLTVLGLSKMVCKFAQIRLRLRDCTKLLSLIHLACLVGLVCHISHIVDEVLNGKLDFSQHFEMIEHFAVPAIVLCFDFDRSSIDPNHRLTGNYLEQLTSEMSAERIFRSIAYLDNQNNWIELHTSNFSAGTDLEVQSIFFQRKKCFSLQLKLTYDLKQFYQSSNEMLRLKFNWSFMNEKRTAHFMTQLTNTMQFSKSLSFRLRSPDVYLNDKNYTNFYRFSYSTSQDLLVLRFEDKFSFIKQLFKSPLSLLNGQVDSDDMNYLFRLLRGFKKHNKATLNLPLSRDLFDLEINETAFESFFESFEKQQKSSVSSNYEREYPNLYLRQESRYCEISRCYPQVDPDLSFSLIPFKKVIVSTQTSGMNSLPELILNLLNLFSTWLDLRILNVPLYILVLKRFLSLAYQSLLQIRRLL